MAENSLLKQTDDIVTSLDKTFGQLPHLPANIREVLVKIAPWISLIFGVLGVIAGLGIIGLSPIAALGGVNTSVTVLISGVVTLVSSALMILAFPKLNKKSYAGWRFLFWSEVVSAISAIIAISVGGILGVLIGLYLLFEIKSYYK